MMEQDLKQVEQIFDAALRHPPGDAREALLAKACGGDEGLRGEVKALLRAHEGCGRFLDGAAVLTSDGFTSPQQLQSGTVVLSDGAARAAAYLSRGEARPPVAEFLASLPETLRDEVRERIEAALASRAAVPPRRPLPESEVAPLIPGFKLRRVLGRGGLGTVYEAWDEKLERDVALKVLRPRGETEARPRILTEARRAAGVHDSAIVTIYSVMDETDPPAIVMELVSGFPLDQFCQNLTFPQKARLLQEVARGLAVAHAQGLIHRDLKPDNVLVGPDMRPKILDFGLAIPEDEGRGGLGYFEGSPLYASPEQAAGKPLTPASDLFSFGSMMFKVLTGQPPFPGQNLDEVLRAIATTHPPFLREVAAGTPEDLQAVCLACLSWKAADRPTAAELVVELGRYLGGEPVHLKPKLYDDILRQRISAYSTEAQSWERQSMISRDERDALQAIHRRMLADEDHWIIDTRRLTLVQTALYAGSWLAVVSAALMVSLLREEMGTPWRWLGPMSGTVLLLVLGWWAERRREALASASFLAAGALSIAPSMLAFLAEFHVLARPVEGVTQLFQSTFTNQQVLAAGLIAWLVSVLGLARLKMTGFAWTATVLGTASYLAVLLQLDWLSRKPEIMALWCLPLVAVEPIALFFERIGRVRWTMPFHLLSLVALVGVLDILASEGPTLRMLGVTEGQWGYFDDKRLHFLSFALNGILFLTLMLLTERSTSLDLRRGSKALEGLGILHTLSPLFLNAFQHRKDSHVTADVVFYLLASGSFLALAPWRARWRLLTGGLAGAAFGSYLLVELDLVDRKTFVIALGLAGLAVAVATFGYLRRAARPRSH